MSDGAPDVSLLDGAFYAGDPCPAFAWMRRNQPVYRDPQSGVWGVSRYHDVKVVATTPELFSMPRRPANFVSGIESMPVTFTPEQV